VPHTVARKDKQTMIKIIVKLILKPVFGFRGQKSHTIKLPSNASTGYSWQLRERYCPSIISESHRYVQFQGPPGTGGEEIWTFTAIGKGEEIVKLVYASEATPEDFQDEREIHFTVH